MIIISVEQLAGHIRTLLEGDLLLSDVWVSGEISNVSKPASGHCYFTLKDTNAQIRCALFRQKARPAYLDAVQHGAQVLAHGYVSFYEVRGDIQLYVDAVQPEGVGILQAEFERLFARLEAEGLFTPDRKRPLPPFPRRIGLVTSPTGAVFHDICHVIERRWPLVELMLAPTLVQGDGAAEGVAGAIVELNRRADVDLIIVARGGGSMEDLWAFNEEPVARAIYGSRIPVISAIGHETDYTIADHVADCRAPTPSAAAEIAVPDQLEVAAKVGNWEANLGFCARQTLQDRSLDLSDSVSRLRHCRPDPRSFQGHVDALLDSARRFLSHALALRAERLEGRERQLAALSPLQTLARGYAVVQNSDGNVIRLTSQARPGAPLNVRVSDGEFAARVEGARPSRAQSPPDGELERPRLF